jgi:hypothetical protein
MGTGGSDPLERKAMKRTGDRDKRDDVRVVRVRVSGRLLKMPEGSGQSEEGSSKSKQ